MATNQGCKGLVPGDELEHKFLYYFLLGSVDLLDSLGTGTTFKELSGGTLKQVSLPVPPLDEQQRIVRILDEAFDSIATAKVNAERNLANAKALFESILNLPESAQASLGDLIQIKTGKLDANAAVDNGPYPFFTCAREIYAIDDYAFDCEAILLAGNNAVGDFNVKHYKGKFNAYQRTYVITVNDVNSVDYRFLFFQILKNMRNFKSMSVGAGTKFLKLGMIKDLQIALPSIENQLTLAGNLDQAYEATERLESLYNHKLSALDELKQSLLHQAFAGEL